MQRNPSELTNKLFDLLVIGGGIYGAAIAWRASLAGFSVALIEQNDFASGTSANSQKIIHGGLRYVQTLDLKRIVQSLSERKRLMWLAPHLVKPLPFIMPLSGYGLKGREALWLGTKLYNLISLNRNILPDKDKYIPSSHLINDIELKSILPDFSRKDLRGAALWYDAFCGNTERLVLSLLKSAVEYGAVISNYVKAVTFIKEKNNICGAEANDKISQSNFDIRAKYTVNCSGSWIQELAINNSEKLPYAAGINIVINKSLPLNSGLGVNDPLTGRMYVAVPWKDKFIVGTEWMKVTDPLKFTFSDKFIRKLLTSFNRAYPAAELSNSDITFIHKGFVPAQDAHSISLRSEFKIQEGSDFGLSGYYSVSGVKYTTALNVAEQVLQRIFRYQVDIPLMKQPKLIGGQIDIMKEFTNDVFRKWNYLYPASTLNDLISDYGSEVNKVLSIAESDIEFHDHSFLRELLKAQVLYAIRSEMALTLEDIILRRTSIGSHERPSSDVLHYVSRIAGQELKWTHKKTNDELEKMGHYYVQEQAITEWSS